MKKFTFFLLAALISVAAFAQKPVQTLRSAVPFEPQKTQIQAQGVARTANTTKAKAPRRSLGLVTAPTDAEAVTYYTVDGTLAVYSGSGFSNYTSNRPSIQVIVDGTDIYIAGLAYWAESAWIKGTIEGTTATFPAAQQVDDDETYPEWMHGSDDGSTITDIVFTFDQEAGTLVSETQYIFEADSETEASLYAYWIKPSFSATEPEGPELVALPEDAETVEYVLTYTASDGSDGSAPAKVAVVGDEVYVQGISYYLPDAWVKGVKDGNVVTFAGNQYVGTYGSYGESYAFYNGDTEFTYDPETESYSAEGQVFGVLGGRYYDGNYTNPVLKKVIEQAATPADPAITGLNNGDYGYYITFNIPTVDVDGNGLVTSKLFYEIYTDIEKEVSPLTFTSATHQELTEDMTVIPYGFTENYDFYDTAIFLNGLYSEDWNKIGIKSIYTGGGETNETEIQWFDIKDYAAGPASVTWVAAEQGYENSEDVTEIAIDDYTTGALDKAEGSNSPKYYTSGTALRMYAGNTLTITSENEIAKIEFTLTGSEKQMQLEADKGEYALEDGIGTWTGEETEIVFSVPSTSGAQARIQKIKIVYVGSEEPEEFDPADIDLPEYVYDFNDGTLQGWTTIDADGDGYTWNVFDDSAVYSQSYVNGVGAVEPDNYLVSPKLNLDGCITFYAQAQDGSYPAEHFGVAVSTKGNEDAADFETIAEWTLTASRGAKAPRKAQGNWYEYSVDLRGYEGAEGYVAIRHFDCTDQFYIVVDNITLKSSHVQQPDIVVTPSEGLVDALSTVTLTFNNYEVALPEGESAQAELYLNDNFDEPIATASITVTDGKYLTATFAEQTAKGEYTVLFPDGTIQNATTGEILPDLEYHYAIYPKDIVELPEGVEAETWYFTATASESTYNVSGAEVAVAIDGTDIYVQGINHDYLPEAWVKGVIDAENGTATFELGQFFGTFTYQGSDYDMWFVGTPDGSNAGDVTFQYDAANKLLLLTDGYIIISAKPNAVAYYEYYYDVEISAEQPEGPVEAPEDLVTETYVFKSNAYENNSSDEGITFEPYQIQVQVGYDGDDLYIQGISTDAPEFYVRATKNEDGQYVIPAGQYMGQVSYWGGYFIFDYYFTALDEEGNLTDVVLSLDAETGTLTTDQRLALNGAKRSLEYYLLYQGAEITKFVEVAAVPADPEVVAFNANSTYPNAQFSIVAEDIDGNLINESKLFYTIYYVKDETVNQLTFETSLYNQDFEEDVIEVPYTHSGYDIYKGGSRVYLNQTDVADWTNIGVQAIYYGAGERNVSAIAWLNAEDPIVTAINGITEGKVATVYFDLQGRVASQAQKGLLIMQTADGRTVKVVRK